MLKREMLKSRKDSKSHFRFQSASIVFHSTGLNLTAAAATFSSRCATDDVPGIGPRRRRALLTRFGSVAGIRRATREELAAAVGAKLADAVLAFFATRP